MFDVRETKIYIESMREIHEALYEKRTEGKDRFRESQVYHNNQIRLRRFKK